MKQTILMHATLALFVAAAAPGAAAAYVDHLYVSGGANEMVRYRVANGVPASKPDLTYSSVGAPMFVDGAGNVYAMHIGATNLAAVAEFPLGKVHAERAVNIRWPAYIYAQIYPSLFVDRPGDVFVAFWIETSLDLKASGSPGLECLDANTGILVYPPGAHAFAAPTQCVIVSNGGAPQPDTMAMDAQGNLFVDLEQILSGFEPDVYVFSNPVGHPAHAGRLTGDFVAAPEGIVDNGGELYVANQGFQTPSYQYPPAVDVFADTARGDARPIRMLQAQVGQQWTGSIAVDDHYLYIAGPPGVLVFPKGANGVVGKPIATLPVQQPPDSPPVTIAVGR
jgi:hypothetical protein